MTQDAEDDTAAEATGRRRSFWWRWIALPLLVIAAAVALAVWFQRHTIAGNVIDNYLRSHHVRASYKIEHIGGTREILSHLVIGDPAHPDLTVERAEVAIRYRFGIPAIGGVTLVRPRLYGTYLHGKLSFGALDPLVFPPRQPAQPFELPDYTLNVIDGRGLLETDYGPVGLKAEGQGYLRGGFKGVLAATAPQLRFGGCRLAGTTLYGKLGIDAERPTFTGPVRLRSLDCGGGSTQLGETAVEAGIKVDRDFAGADGTLAGDARAVKLAGAVAEALHLKSKLSFRGGDLTASYDLAATGVAHPQAQLATFGASGSLRAGGGFDWIRLEADFKGSGLHPGPGLDAALGRAADSAGETLPGDVLRKVRGALLHEANGSSLVGQLSWSKTGAVSSLVVPQASVIGGSGEPLLSLSRFRYGSTPGTVPRLAGNIATGGRDLPRIEATIEQEDGGFAARLAMAPYAVQGGSIAIPSLAVVSKAGRIGFAGRSVLTGDLPGGRAEGLQLPLSGNWSSASGLAMWQQCTPIAFDSLRVANLTLQHRGLTVCPAMGQPILRYGAAGLRIAAGVPALDVGGTLGRTPVAIRSGPIGFAWPGTVTARQLLVTLGPRGTATTFAVNDLTARVGKTVAGRFGGTDVKLFSVPMDIVDASGNWDYANGQLHIADGAFRLVDRQKPPRFEPLVASGATLALRDNLITAQAALRVPDGGPEVTQVALSHDLATGRGHADLTVPGLTFGKGLQPEQLTQLALGVVANVQGTVTGSGRIDWDEKGVTSSGVCLLERRIGNADITFRFPRDWLPDWQNVAGGIDRLIARLHPG